jgi:superfamily II DNA or RNA helicase
MILKHDFVNKCPDIDALLKNKDGEIINSIESFCGKIKYEAEKNASLIDPNQYKGCALEMFVEYFIKDNGKDNRIGIYDYEITGGDTEDNGVDGYGIGENSYPATVQVKFRSGNYVLTANEDHLSNFLTSSWADFQVPIECDKNMLIITTGMKIDEQSKEKMLKNKVRVLNRDNLREMCDNRPEFWIRFYEAIKENRVKKETVTPIVLREHQTEAVNAFIADKNRKGKIIMPTGTGKTIIEAEIIRYIILKCQEQGTVPVIKVNASRILLCFQLFEEIFAYLNSHGIAAKHMNFNSGNADEKYYAIMLRKTGGIFRNIISTTSPNAVKEQFNKAQHERIPLIAFSTYHSSVRFSESEVIPDLTIHDEAHNLVSREFSKAATLPSKENFYFTATEKVTDSDTDLGMNNKDIFDEVIYQRSAKEMMDKGEMVKPRIHIVKGHNNGVDVENVDADYNILFSSIISAFMSHSTQIKADSYAANKIGAKVLVVCRGQQDLIEMFKTTAFKEFKENHPEIHLFALSSEFGMLNDGEWYKPPVTNMKKHKMLSNLKKLPSEEQAIIFHVDMVGEGIDVPGITGVMPFRNCEMSKFVQNIGRAARLHSYDRKRFYNNEISPSDLTKYVKPYSWVIIPDFLVNSNGFADRFRGIINKLRNDYDVTKENVLISNIEGMEQDEDIDVVNELNKKRNHSKSGITDFSHEFEEKTCIEKIIFDMDISEKTDAAINELESLINT